MNWENATCSMHGTRAARRLQTEMVLASALLAGLLGFVSQPCSGEESASQGDGEYGKTPYRAFRADSYYNTPLPLDAPVDPRSDEFIADMKAHSDPDYLILGGTERRGDWGMPIYWAKPSDPRHVVRQMLYPLPKEFTTSPGIRIPPDAKPDPTSDGELTIYDLEAGYVCTLWIFGRDAKSGQVEAYGGSIYFLKSNGLHGSWRGLKGSDARNTGHRGMSQGTQGVVRYDEIASGHPIEHVLKIAIGRPSASHVFPMTGSDGEANGLIPEGARLRIKPSVDLTTKGLSAPALTIARALQKYGAIVGDRGGHVCLKVENTVAEGRGWLWKDILEEDSLASIPLDDFEFILMGWGENGEWLKDRKD